ncbi:MAG TPA: hypothetical protein VIT92_16050 [Burkholderiaceae bacterium]
MLQANELYQRFRSIEQTIALATDACMSDSEAPADLKERVQELEQQSFNTREAMASANPRRIVAAIDELEEYGDRAAHACRAAGSVHPELKSAVIKAHDAVSDLKHLLH